jgi:hypothetical protein
MFAKVAHKVNAFGISIIFYWQIVIGFWTLG